MCVCVCARARVCVCACVRASVWVCFLLDLPTYIYIHTSQLITQLKISTKLRQPYIEWEPRISHVLLGTACCNLLVASLTICSCFCAVTTIMADGEYKTGFAADFEPPLDKKHECPVCYFALRDPIQTSCGHRFCTDCINQILL